MASLSLCLGMVVLLLLHWFAVAVVGRLVVEEEGSSRLVSFGRRLSNLNLLSTHDCNFLII